MTIVTRNSETRLMPINSQGCFITVEGGEGAGKTTNMTFIKQCLDNWEVPYIHTREPGGTDLAEQIRELLLSKRDEKVAPTAELLLVFAARAQHLAEVIIPALQQGKIVLCDRFTDATYAYQGGGRQLDVDLIAELEQRVQGALRPDLTLLLDVSIETGMARAGQRGELDRFEQENIAFFNRVRDAYLARAEEYPQQFAIIDAGKSLNEVQAQIKSVLAQRFKHIQ